MTDHACPSLQAELQCMTCRTDVTAWRRVSQRPHDIQKGMCCECCADWRCSHLPRGQCNTKGAEQTCTNCCAKLSWGWCSTICMLGSSYGWSPTSVRPLAARRFLRPATARSHLRLCIPQRGGGGGRGQGASSCLTCLEAPSCMLKTES